jgi:hypothetical protein
VARASKGKPSPSRDLREAIQAISVIDGHCHSIQPGPLRDEAELLSLFSESRDERLLLDHGESLLFVRRVLKDWARLLGCKPSVEDILRARRARDPGELARRLVKEARIEALLVDEGFPPEALSVDELGELLPCSVYPVLRLESLMERLFLEEESFEAFLGRFDEEVASARQRGYVALKSIIAYRVGLQVERADRARAEAAYRGVRLRVGREGRARAQQKPLLELCLWRALEHCARQGLALQLHTGFGDPDLDLRLSNPLHLRALLEEVSGETNIVLLHAGYPFLRETAYLAGIYANLFVDFSLALPLVHARAASVVAELLELAPWGKLLYGSDGHTVAELYFWAANQARDALAETLEELVERGVLDEGEALQAARDILQGNARALYGLP